MARPPVTSAEAENRTAFLVQLSVLLTNVTMAVNSTSLSTASKAKLSDIRTAVEELVQEVGEVCPPKPFVIHSAAPVVSGDEPETSISGPTATSSVAGTTPLTGAVAHEMLSVSDIASNSFTGEFAQLHSILKGDTPAACSIGSKSIVDVVAFVELLFTSGIPESSRLRVIAKNLCRLVTVRCTSTIMATLQHVVYHTYGKLQTPDEVGNVPEKLTVLLARDIRLSVCALQRCLELVAFDADLTDASATRFPLQLCVDVLKHTRRAMNYFHSRLEREELARMRRTWGEREEAPLEQYVKERAADLVALWGPALTRSIVNVGSVIPTAVKYIISVASIKHLGTHPELVELRASAQNDLFALADPCHTTVVSLTSGRSLSRKPSPRSTNPNNELSAGPSAEADVRSGVTTPEVASEAATSKENSQSLPTFGSLLPSWRAAVGTVALRIGISYLFEYVTTIAELSGDESVGRLICTRVMSDALHRIASEDPSAPRFITAIPRWQKKLCRGILTCLVSLQPAVLCAALDTLQVMVTHTGDALTPELGLLYSGLFRLLESDNCPEDVKKHLLLHLLRTFLQPPSAASAGVPILLYIYWSYDLNTHAHELNVVQQFITALSRIVRQAPRSAFTQAEAPPATIEDAGPWSHTSNELDAPERLSVRWSLPSLALHGLVMTVDLLGGLAPPEDDSGEADALGALPSLPHRAEKLREQQLVDLFNVSPKKFVEKHFQVSKEEMNPQRPASMAHYYECEHLPCPATEEAAEKVAAVVDFMVRTPSLTPEAVADFLTLPAVFPLQVCVQYMARLDLAGLGILDGLKVLLATVQLPREGQRIERLLEYFCGAYYKANCVSGVDSEVFPFESADACTIVVVATVMLNTNIHNPLVTNRMSPLSFKAQLRGCNDGSDFEDRFLDDIFSSVSRHPLGSMKGIADGGAGARHSPAVTASDTRHGLDALFVSQEERRHIAFALERQRLVCDVSSRLLRPYAFSWQPVDATGAARWGRTAARDLFLSSWSAVCAVFGPAMYEGDSPPVDTLVKCVRGLQALMCVAASFALSTECEVMLLALLRMCIFDTVRDSCRSAVLVVASTAYSVYFSPRCWFSVISMVMVLRQQNNAMQSQVEAMLTRVESYTRLSCLGQANTEHPKGAAATIAVQRVLEGSTDVLRDIAVGDGLSLSTGLYYLKRTLGFSMIARTSKATTVAHYVNVRDFTQIVLPRLSQLVYKHRSSDEALQVLLGFAVDRLGAMWTSYASYPMGDTAPHLGHPGAPSTANPVSPLANDLGNFIDSFGFFNVCYRQCAGDRALVKTQLLQAVNELLSRMVHSLEGGASCSLNLHTVIAVWRRVLRPLATALSDAADTGTEVSSFAGLVLRKLVVLFCGTRAVAQIASSTPFHIRAVALVLLAHVSYIGSMCSDVDCALVCLAQLPTIVTAALTSQPAVGGGSPPSPPSPHYADEIEDRVVDRVTGDPALVAQHALERLVLALRAEREQIRSEAVESLRTLSMQLEADRIKDLCFAISETVLEAIAGFAPEPPQQQHGTHLPDSSLISFRVLMMDVPRTMRRSSRAAFRSTLPAVFGFMTNELLSTLPATRVREVADVWMERCLVPVIVGTPRGDPPQVRALAARSLSQCATLALSRAMSAAGSESGTHASHRSQLALQSVMNCTAMVLHCAQLPLDGIVPVDAQFVGREHCVRLPAAIAPAMKEYAVSVQAALRQLAAASPQEISGNPRTASLASRDRAALPTTAAEETNASLATAKQSHSSADDPGSMCVITDEELVDYCNLLVQTLSGLPKVLSSVDGPLHDEEERGDVAAEGRPAAHGGWRPPRATSVVLLQELLQAVGCLFAALWRVRHPLDISLLMSRYRPKGREAPPTALKASNALLPHAAIRGVLNSYLELALRSTSSPLDGLLAVTVEVAGGVSAVQGGISSSGGSKEPTEAAVMQRLNPQEQQHIRTCTVGMYQELSVVLSYWVKGILHPPRGLPAKRLEELHRVALSAELFKALVALLSPNAGYLIVTVRDYFAWYIEQNQLQNERVHADEASSGRAEELPLAEKKLVDFHIRGRWHSQLSSSSTSSPPEELTKASMREGTLGRFSLAVPAAVATVKHPNPIPESTGG